MCIKKPVNYFSQNCTCAKRNSQWASIEESLMSSQHGSKVFGV